MNGHSTLAYLAEAERRGAVGTSLIAWNDCGCSICEIRFRHRANPLTVPEEDVA
ncbi:hypothetical protein NONO_c60040 [Nocardia nova SH22a]|uniref:Uncharacterized protein n=1 Tax=Nocardia nova SH22a TaxID=1415166 RepID=W5TN47_9NOCA|nr:hypothetical protein [Nocardia nova]AHH20780.1 hypothetical protein NONO_c60040 [Nocardia nova SH22a]